MSEWRFWTLTPREMEKLVEVWAMNQATFHNAHFAAKDGIAFTAEDFMNPEARAERQQQTAREKAEVMMETRRLAMMTPDGGETVPQWAKQVVKTVN